jgi:hypothetical protein
MATDVLFPCKAFVRRTGRVILVVSMAGRYCLYTDERLYRVGMIHRDEVRFA